MKSVLVVEPGWYILRHGLLDQLRFLSSCGFRIGIASEDDCRARAVAREIDATFYPLDVCRYPSPGADFSALKRLSAIFREFRPSIVQSSTKKAGLLVGVLGWRYGVSVVYIVRGLNSERVTSSDNESFSNCRTLEFRFGG